MKSTPSDNQKLMQKIEKEIKNKVFGAFFGLIVGDALGAVVESKERGSFKEIKNMRAGGPYNLKAGYWTDDSSMALCLAESLTENGYDPHNQMQKYLQWYKEGYLSSTDECFGIGSNTARSLEYYDKNNKFSPASERAAGNGSLMRLAPAAIYYRDDFKKAIKYSGGSSLTTHNNQLAVDSCRYFGGLLQQFLNTRIEMNAFKIKVIKDTAVDLDLDQQIIKAVNGAFNKNRDQIKSNGFVINTLEASLWSFINSDSFSEAVLLAVNLGKDTDTTAAVTGQLAGSYYGCDAIPKKWKIKLAKYEIIENIATKLYNTTK
jgi:ADP-ribosyl-[dinitrogen reductase] hydrolase